MDPMMCYHQYFENSEVHLPPGFRFHPTDEELIAHYLLRKVLDGNFTGRAIAEVNLNKYEPWELPEKAKMGEEEWYFYCLRDRKYPTGLRTNRATEAGYWKATGNDRDIYSSKTGSLVGMKKTLVFYIGRAPNGVRSNWVIHEYRLEGVLAYHYLPRISKDEWVISRVFQRCGAGSGASVNGGVGKNETSRVSLFQEVDSPSLAVMTSQATRQLVSCINPNYHHHHPPPPFDLIPAPEALESSSSFPRYTGFSAFPTLGSMEEDMRLSLFLSSTSSPMAVHGGFGGLDAGCFSSGDWVGPEEEREEGGKMEMGSSSTEFDCMWT